MIQQTNTLENCRKENFWNRLRRKSNTFNSREMENSIDVPWNFGKIKVLAETIFFFFFWVYKEILNGRISPKQSDYPINSIRTRGVRIKWSKDFDSQFSLATLWSKILIKEKPLGSTTISQRWDVKKWKEEKVSCYSTIFKASSSLAKVVEEVDG